MRKKSWKIVHITWSSTLLCVCGKLGEQKQKRKTLIITQRREFFIKLMLSLSSQNLSRTREEEKIPHLFGLWIFSHDISGWRGRKYEEESPRWWCGGEGGWQREKSWKIFSQYSRVKKDCESFLRLKIDAMEAIKLNSLFKLHFFAHSWELWVTLTRLLLSRLGVWQFIASFSAAAAFNIFFLLSTISHCSPFISLHTPRERLVCRLQWRFDSHKRVNGVWENKWNTTDFTYRARSVVKWGGSSKSFPEENGRERKKKFSSPSYFSFISIHFTAEAAAAVAHSMTILLLLLFLFLCAVLF